MNSSIREQSIESYKEKYKILQSVGNISDIIELSTKILEEYPNEYEVMLNLAKAMFITHEGFGGLGEICIENNYVEKSIDICERILEQCKNYSIRYEATSLLCKAYL